MMRLLDHEDFIPRRMKILSYAVAVLLIVLGLVEVVLSAVIQIIDLTPIQELVLIYLDPVYLSLSTGLMAVVAGILNFVGTIRENLKYLKFYRILMFLMVVLNIAGCIMAIVIFYRPPAISATVSSKLNQSIILYKEDSDLASYIDKMQIQLECCGMHSFKDWNSNQYFSCDDNNTARESCAVPPSCCMVKMEKPIDTTCGYLALENPSLDYDVSIYRKGCLDEALVYFYKALEITTCEVLIFTILLVLFLILAIKVESKLRANCTLQIENQQGINITAFPNPMFGKDREEANQSEGNEDVNPRMEETPF